MEEEEEEEEHNQIIHLDENLRESSSARRYKKNEYP